MSFIHLGFFTANTYDIEFGRESATEHGEPFSCQKSVIISFSNRRGVSATMTFQKRPHIFHCRLVRRTSEKPRELLERMDENLNSAVREVVVA